jgi:hypothetical protein
MAAVGQKRSIFPRGIDEALGVDPRPSLAARNPSKASFLPPMRAHAREARAAGGKHSSAAGDARRQADALQSGKDRGEIMSLVGLDQPEPDKPRDSIALHFDEKPQRLVRGRGAAPPNLR